MKRSWAPPDFTGQELFSVYRGTDEQTSILCLDAVTIILVKTSLNGANTIRQNLEDSARTQDNELFLQRLLPDPTRCKTDRYPRRRVGN